MKLAEYVSPFYDFARRQLKMNPATVNAHLAEHATARIDGRQLVIDSGNGEDRRRIGLGHSKHATRWVNDFNARSAVASKLSSLLRASP